MKTYKWQNQITKEIFEITSNDNNYNIAEKRIDFIEWSTGKFIKRLA